MVAMKNATENAEELIEDLTLAYNKVRDRVSACNQTGQWNCLADDGFNDAMFVVFLHCTSCGTPARRTVTRITIQRTGGGTWDTDTNSAAWVLGVVAAGSNAQVDAPFLNDSETGKVNFVMQNGAEIYIFASDGRVLGLPGV